MKLSNGQIVDLKKVDNGTLIKEEKILHNKFKLSTQSTLSNLHKNKFENCFENEINLFNDWQNVVIEIRTREIKGKLKK